jgi:F0F1-type ATP synthase assembly protein I
VSRLWIEAILLGCLIGVAAIFVQRQLSSAQPLFIIIALLVLGIGLCLIQHLLGRLRL